MKHRKLFLHISQTHAHQGLQVVTPETGLEDPRNTADKNFYAYTKLDQATSKGQSRSRTLCGIEVYPRTYRLAILLGISIITIITLAAIIGGAIGGTLGRKNSSSSPISQTTSSLSPSLASAISQSTSTPPPSLSSTITLSTSTQLSPSSTTLIGPHATAIRDCPSSNNTIYTVNAGAASEQFLKACNTTFLTDAVSAPNQNFFETTTDSLDTCIGLCAAWNTGNHLSSSGLPQTCNVVCWRPFAVGDQATLCFGYSASSSRTGGVYRTTTSSDCDSALWINEPAPSGS